jgi:hypothetical protein
MTILNHQAAPLTPTCADFHRQALSAGTGIRFA